MRTKIVLSALLFCLVTPFASGQSNKKERFDRIKAQKAAFLTQKIGLSSEEAQQFWPIHNEFETKMKSLRKGTPEEDAPGMQRKADIDNMSDKELTQLFQDRFNTEQAVLDLKKTYNEKFIAVLGPLKTAKLYEAEHEFKRELLKKLRENRPQQGGGRP